MLPSWKKNYLFVISVYVAFECIAAICLSPLYDLGNQLLFALLLLPGSLGGAAVADALVWIGISLQAGTVAFALLILIVSCAINALLLYGIYAFVAKRKNLS